MIVDGTERIKSNKQITKLHKSESADQFVLGSTRWLLLYLCVCGSGATYILSGHTTEFQMLCWMFKSEKTVQAPEVFLSLKIKRNDWLLDWLLADTCPQAANHCALF